MAILVMAALSCALSCKNGDDGAAGRRPPEPASSGVAPKASAPAAEPDASGVARSCAVDADCVLVAAGCCDCSNGGKNASVRVSGADAYRTALANRCGETMCTASISMDPSCLPGARARCQSSTCAIVPGKLP